MATSAPGSNLISLTSRAHASAPAQSRFVVVARRRHISREAGRAIEMLGHAIDYLADEFALECMQDKGQRRPGTHPRMAAIEMLMERNREIYFSCPEVPTTRAWLRRWLRRRRA